MVSVVFFGVGFLVAAVSWFQMRLEESERLEKLELDELAKGHATSALFEAKDARSFPRNARANNSSVLCSNIHGGPVPRPGGCGFLALALALSADISVELKQPMVPMFVFGIVFFLGLFLVGRFSATMARLENNRLLRPGAATCS